MMNIQIASGLYARYHDQLIVITHADGTEWVGVISDLPGYPADSDPLAVSFTHIRDLAAYRRDPVSYKGETVLLFPTDVRAIQEMR
ncbi:MAG: hypothetical protein P4L51_10210 [Puia sp.]|nr:hypothetical protein [Puia sp.]